MSINFGRQDLKATVSKAKLVDYHLRIRSHSFQHLSCSITKHDNTVNQRLFFIASKSTSTDEQSRASCLLGLARLAV